MGIIFYQKQTSQWAKELQLLEREANQRSQPLSTLSLFNNQLRRTLLCSEISSHSSTRESRSMERPETLETRSPLPKTSSPLSSPPRSTSPRDTSSILPRSTSRSKMFVSSSVLLPPARTSTKCASSRSITTRRETNDHPDFIISLFDQGHSDASSASS